MRPRYVITHEPHSVDEQGRYLGIGVPGAIQVPFAYPGQDGPYRWNFDTHGWEPVTAVDASGKPLASLFGPAVALLVAGRIPSPKAVWDAQELAWKEEASPRREVVERTTVGGEEVRVSYAGSATSPEALALKSRAQAAAPELDCDALGNIGIERGAGPSGDDLLTAYFYKPLPQPLVEAYGFESGGNAFALKLFLGSGHRALKLIDGHWRPHALPALPAEAQVEAIGVHRTLEPTLRWIEARKDVYFHASEERLAQFCRASGLDLPKEAEGPAPARWVFGLTFDADSLRPVRLKRYAL